MIIARFSNETGKPIELMIEPWATQVTIGPGSHFAVHYPPPKDRTDTSYAEIYDGMVRFQCEGDTFEVEVDGKVIET
jgi:hypothetical protein